MYKILRSHPTEDAATWDTESYLNQNFHVFLISLQGTRTFPSNFTHPNLGTRFFLGGVGCNTPGVSNTKLEILTMPSYRIAKIKLKQGISYVYAWMCMYVCVHMHVYVCK